MPDTRKHPGPGPQGSEWFGPSHPRLVAAGGGFALFLPPESALGGGVVAGRGVRCYLHHNEPATDRGAIADVLTGRYDAEVRMLFGDATLAVLKAEIRRQGTA